MGMNCHGCGVDIHFQGDIVSKSGKCIPLEFNNAPHNCPASTWAKKKEFKYGAEFTEADGFYAFGNVILHRADFCESCGLYKGLLLKSNGHMVSVPNSTRKKNSKV
jgi:hypothetical protein